MDPEPGEGASARSAAQDRDAHDADLGSMRDGIDMLEYLPRREPVITTGNITSYRISMSADGVAFTEAASGLWPANPLYHGLISPQRAQFPSSNARYVRLEATGVAGGAAAIAGEVAVGKGESASASATTTDGGSATDASVVDGRGPEDADAEVGPETRSPESGGAGGNAPTIDADVGNGQEASTGPGATATADAAREAEAPAAGAPSASKGCNCSTSRAGPSRSLVLALLAVFVAGRQRRAHRQA